MGGPPVEVGLDPVLARTITHAYEVVCLENRTP